MFLLAQISIIACMGYGLSQFEIGMQTLLWLIFISVVWIGLVAVYVLVSAVDRVVERLNAISKQINMTPQEKEARP
jgi:hypothetical protein